VFRRGATIAAALAVLATTAVAAPSARAAESCPTPPLCVETDQHGNYYLSVPPLSLVALVYPQVEPLKDCYWEAVGVDFGDGSPDATYVWDATKELTGSHKFPAPGVYTVHVDATQGTHQESGLPCPDFPITATVTYPVPPPVEEPPVEEPPAEPPPGQTEGGGTGASNLVAAGATAPDAFSQAPGEANAYWRRCRAGVLTHGVSCRKGRRVASGARRGLARGGSTRVAGFTCSLQPALSRPLTCRRGPARIEAPA
jgi:hypothetical protein